MSTDRDTTRIVRSWLEEGVTTLPDRVLDNVLDQVPATSQRRPFWSAWRFPQMNPYVRIATLAGVALVVAVVGYTLLPRNGGFGGQPTPTPVLTPSTQPTPMTLGSTDLDTPVAGGRYAFQVGSPGDGRYFPIEVTLPAGWVPQQLDVDAVALGAADGIYLGFFSVQRVYLDPCHPEDGYAGGYLGTSNTNDLVNELRSLAGFQAGVTSTVPIGDLQATHFAISNSIDTAAAGCTDGALLPLFITWTADRNAELAARDGHKSPATNGGAAQEVWIVDRKDLYPLLIVGETGRLAEAGRATLDAIVASIVIKSTGAALPSSVP